jgi:large subunit ribosomal protein L22
MGYTYQGDTEKTARALGSEVNVSPKNANEVCKTIKGMKVNVALGYLDRVVKKESHVPYTRFNKKVPHRRGGQPGRYPEKAAREVKKVLENAKNNAEYKGLDNEKLKIRHANAYKAMTLQRTKPKGRARPHNIELTNIEIVVSE